MSKKSITVKVFKGRKTLWEASGKPKSVGQELYEHLTRRFTQEHPFLVKPTTEAKASKRAIRDFCDRITKYWADNMDEVWLTESIRRGDLRYQSGINVLEYQEGQVFDTLINVPGH